MSLLFNMLSQFSSVTQSCLTLCDPMNHSTPGLPVHHQLPEFTQIHVHRVGDARLVVNIRYPDDTTLMAESEEELKRLLMKVKEEHENIGLKLNIQKLRSWHLVPSLYGK